MRLPESGSRTLQLDGTYARNRTGPAGGHVSGQAAHQSAAHGDRSRDRRTQPRDGAPLVQGGGESHGDRQGLPPTGRGDRKRGTRTLSGRRVRERQGRMIRTDSGSFFVRRRRARIVVPAYGPVPREACPRNEKRIPERPAASAADRQRNPPRTENPKPPLQSRWRPHIGLTPSDIRCAHPTADAADARPYVRLHAGIFVRNGVRPGAAKRERMRFDRKFFRFLRKITNFEQ